MKALAYAIGNVDKQLPAADKNDAEDEGGRVAENRRESGAGDSQGGKAPVPHDQKPVEENIDRAGKHVVNKGQIRLSETAERGVDLQEHEVEDHAGHHNPEIGDGGFQGIRLPGKQDHDRPGQGGRQKTQDNAQHHNDLYRVIKNPVGRLLISLSVIFSNQAGGDCVHGEEDTVNKETGLVGYGDRRNGRHAQGGNHFGVNDRHKGRKQGFQKRGNPDFQDFLRQAFLILTVFQGHLNSLQPDLPSCPFADTASAPPDASFALGAEAPGAAAGASELLSRSRRFPLRRALA